MDGDGVINFLNERSQYKRTIEELNEKLSTYEKNSKIMKGFYYLIIQFIKNVQKNKYNNIFQY